MEPIVSCVGEGFLSCAVGTGAWAAGMKGGTTNLYAYGSSNVISAWEGPAPVKAAEFAPSDSCILVGNGAGALRVVSVVAHDDVWSCSSAHVASLEVARYLDGNCFVSGDANGNLALWDIRQEGVVRRWRGEDYVADMAVVDGQAFVVAYGDGVCCRYCTAMPKRAGYFVQEDDDFATISIDRYGQYVLLGSSAPKLYVLTVANLEFKSDMKSLGANDAIVTLRHLPSSRGRFIAVHLNGVATLGQVQPNAPLYAFRALEKGSLVIGAEAGFGKLVVFGLNRAAVFDVAQLVAQDFGKRRGGKAVRVTERHDPFFDEFA